MRDVNIFPKIFLANEFVTLWPLYLSLPLSLFCTQDTLISPSLLAFLTTLSLVCRDTVEVLGDAARFLPEITE